MKTLIFLVIALVSSSAVYATQADSTETLLVQRPQPEKITVTLADETTSVDGKCTAVCMLPASFD